MLSDRNVTVKVRRQGSDRQPVIVIDDFAADPQALIDRAAQCAFTTIGPYFPGLRARVPAAVAAGLINPLIGLIRETFGITARFDRIEFLYSLVTRPPDQLQLVQRMPHFDGLGPACIAVLLHLGRAERGGTAFYRHRTTGFETIDAARAQPYFDALNADVARLGAPDGYISGDTPLFERIAFHEARFNRLLIYSGATLHSGDIPEDLALTPDPRTGRFSINGFLWLKGA